MSSACSLGFVLMYVTTLTVTVLFHSREWVKEISSKFHNKHKKHCSTRQGDHVRLGSKRKSSISSISSFFDSTKEQSWFLFWGFRVHCSCFMLNKFGIALWGEKNQTNTQRISFCAFMALCSVIVLGFWENFFDKCIWVSCYWL